MNSEPIFILLVIFGSIFGIFYLYFTTRNRERLALIEKGVDAQIFSKGRRKGGASYTKVFVLNLAVLLMGVGLGIFLGAMAHYNFGLEEEVAYPGTIFLMAGIGLFVGFTLTKKLDKEEQDLIA